MKKNFKYKIIFSFLLFFFLFSTNIVFALEINYPRLPFTSPLNIPPPQDFINTAPKEEQLALYIKYFYYLFLWIAGIITLGSLIVGGLKYLFSMGKPESIISAKEQISGAIIGLLILFCSFLILNVLDPQFVIFKNFNPSDITFIQKETVPTPELKKDFSSIHVELPFGRIIEAKILENYISDIEPNQNKKKPRMQIIKDNANNTLKIAENLKKQSENLNNYSDRCTCYSSVEGGAVHCCPHPFDPPSPEMNNPAHNDCEYGTGCFSKPGKSSDPCKSVRPQIENEYKKDLEELEKLKKEKEISLNQIKELNYEINRLRRVRDFIDYCPYDLKDSLAEFYNRKDEYSNPFQIKLFDDVNIAYKNEKGEKTVDWASFLCIIGGNILKSVPIPFETDKEGISVEPVVIPQEKAVSYEVPVGEIIDRTLRIGNKIVFRLEELVELDELLMNAINQMHALISQCSSRSESDGRKGCYSICWCCDPKCKTCCKAEHQSINEPCPTKKIDDQLKIIQDLYKQFELVVNEKKDQQDETLEVLGINPLIDDVVPNILSDLQKIKYYMSVCSTIEHPDVLLTCERALGYSYEENKRIELCCMEQYPFNDCLQECYLEKDYKKCLNNCLARKSKELNDESLVKCRHKINFYCSQR